MTRSLKIQLFFIKTVMGLLLFSTDLHAQLRWKNVDSLFQPLPSTVHVFFSNDSLDGKPSIAYYAEADLKSKQLVFTADTAYKRRLTPAAFYEKNDHPLLLVNSTFFNFDKNQNLNTVIIDGKQVSYNIHSLPARGKDTFTYNHPLGSAIGISKNRTADIAWLYTDSSRKYPIAFQTPIPSYRDSNQKIIYHDLTRKAIPQKWRMRTAIGGGPVLLQNNDIKITNNEEMKFAGKAINDKHPRTAMGYTRDKKLIILVIQGRFPGIAEGATLTQEARIFKDLGCYEALNLDGGGSSCMLINGKETIKPSDKAGPRPTPAVFVIRNKN